MYIYIGNFKISCSYHSAVTVKKMPCWKGLSVALG